MRSSRDHKFIMKYTEYKFKIGRVHLGIAVEGLSAGFRPVLRAQGQEWNVERASFPLNSFFFSKNALSLTSFAA